MRDTQECIDLEAKRLSDWIDACVMDAVHAELGTNYYFWLGAEAE